MTATRPSSLSSAGRQGGHGSPGDQVYGLLMGAWQAQITFVLARMGVPDELASGPRDSGVLAEAVGADPEALPRLLRAAATLGLLAEPRPGEFALTELGACLRSGVPGSLREQALAYGTEANWRLVGDLGEIIRIGRSTAHRVLGGTLWEYLKAHPEDGEHFSRAMGERSSLVAAQVAKVVDPSGHRRIADVGGAYGELLVALLARAPGATGILFDLPPVIESARARLSPERRIELVGGDFFEAVPEADLYLLKWVLHDWDDECATRILASCRRAASPDARLLVVETVLPEPFAPSPAYLSDLSMLVLLDGRERSEPQYRALLAASGWRLDRVTPTEGDFTVLEAVPDRA